MKRTEGERLPLDAAALDRLRGRTFLPGPETTDKLIAQSRAALTLAASVAELEDENEDLFNESLKWEIHANALRDALKELRGVCMEPAGTCALKYPHYRCRSCQDNEVIDAALAAHPAASLAAHDAEVLDNVLGLMDSVSINYTESEWHELGRKLREQRDALAAQAQDATHSVPDGTSEVTK